MGASLAAALGLQPGKGGRSQDNFFADTGQLPLKDKPDADTSAKATDPMMVKGARQEKGSETYIEIRGPASLGQKSKTPYTKVLPKYKKQAEDALDKQQIPKEHQKRVKDYFNSLQGGG